MGLDFLSKARASIQKGWSYGCEELSRPGLFSADPGSPKQILAFVCKAGTNLTVGTQMVLFVDGEKLLARHETAVVATALDAPQDVLDRIRDASNCALGTVQGVHKLSRVLDIEME